MAWFVDASTVPIVGVRPRPAAIAVVIAVGDSAPWERDSNRKRRDVQATVRRLVDDGVTVDILGIGSVKRGAGEIVLAVLAQVADLERQKIRDRTTAGRSAAKAALAATGRTHRGKARLGRPRAKDAAIVNGWRQANGASIAATAAHFKLSAATVKRYLAAARRATVREVTSPNPLSS